MGSNHSREATNSSRQTEERGVGLQYGPGRNGIAFDYEGQNNVTTSLRQPPQLARSVSTQPPSYSAIDPSNVYNSETTRQGLGHPSRPASSQRYSHVSAQPPSYPAPEYDPHRPTQHPFQQPPPIPPLPHKLQETHSLRQQKDLTKPLGVDKNPYKWSRNEMASEMDQHSRPQPQSAKHAYLPRSAPKNLMFDLNQELGKIQQNMKQNKLPSFQHFNKELSKNKSVSDTRRLMVNNKYLSDVTFIIGGSVFFGHKTFLITASFLFFEHFLLKGEKEMTVDSIDLETFHQVISYCYTDKIDVTQDNVLELLSAGNKLQIRQITNVCHGFISNMMNYDSIFLIFEKALELDYELFLKKCLEFIIKNEEKCFSSKGFFSLSLPSMMKILSACNYSREKTDEIVHKWSNGAMEIEAETSKPPVTKPQPSGPRAQNQNVNQGKNMAQSAQGAMKKENPKQRNRSKSRSKINQIPELMSLPFAPPHYGPPSVTPFGYSQPNMPFNPLFNAHRPFAANQKNPQLITVDDDDDASSKNNANRIKIGIHGLRQHLQTEVSRLDFVCKRSMMIHEIWFTEDLALNCKEFRVNVTVQEGDKQIIKHNRVIQNNKPGMRLNFVRFSRDPVKIFIGQKFFIKLKFSETGQRININVNGLASNPMVELCKDSDGKKYFNCISSLVVSAMP